MFAVRFILTIMQTTVTATAWYDYFLNAQYHPRSVSWPLAGTVLAAVLWCRLIHLAFKRDREDQ